MRAQENKIYKLNDRHWIASGNLPSLVLYPLIYHTILRYPRKRSVTFMDSEDG